MTTAKRERFFKFFLYCIVIVLINIAGLTLFFRWDLTSSDRYSLSPVSQEVVNSLSEPLTIKAFFSRDLPPPYNTVERYLQDLLTEYRLRANQNFNYSIIHPGPENEQDRQLAESYGIRPMQVEVIKEDELQYKKVYMGLAIIHGDVVETLTNLSSTGNLEYRLTSSIEKMKNKVSALLNLSRQIEVTLFLSSSLKRIAPVIGLEQLEGLPGEIQELVADLNTENYQKLAYRQLDPNQLQSGESLPQGAELQKLKWPNMPEEGIEAGEGSIGLVLEHGDQVRTISLLEVVRLPLFGTQYNLLARDQLKTSIDNSLKTMLGINQTIGYVSGHGIPPLGQQPGRPPGQQRFSVAAFRQLVQQNYTLQEVDLEQGVPDGLQCLLITGPTEPFSEFELYQLDQALMQGTNLGIFLDGVSQQSSPQMQAMQQPPAFGPNRTGLEKLVSTYGVQVQESLVLDEHCYKQRLNQQMGGGERPIYFAPIIKNKNINHQLDFLHNIKGLVGLKHSPLQPLEQVLQDNTLDLQALFSSSERSWTLRENINLNPMYLQPPQSEEDLSSRLLACLIQGEFPSHFAGQPIPEKKTEDETGDGESTKGSPEPGEQSAAAADLSRKIDTLDTRRKTGKFAKISLIGSSDLLSDSVVDQQGSSVNAVFLMNLLDELNGRTEMAKLRSKVQQFNPIQETSSRAKMWIKTLNIAGLPCLVLLVGLLVWAARIRRKNHIRMLFSAESRRG